jgi:hypothetical protein
MNTPELVKSLPDGRRMNKPGLSRRGCLCNHLLPGRWLLPTYGLTDADVFSTDMAMHKNWAGFTVQLLTGFFANARWNAWPELRQT